MAMYSMIGGDGREYGPVSAEQLRQWFAEGRVDRNTQIRGEGQAEWFALSEFAEFADLVAVPRAVAPAPVMPLPETVSPPPCTPAGGTAPVAAVPINSGLAVASLVMGILSLFCCGLLALPAIICGHLARREIAASNGALGGDGMARAGMIIGYVVVGIALVGVLFVLSASIIA